MSKPVEKPSSLTNLSIKYDKTTKKDADLLLNKTISLTLKRATFLNALDGVLSETGNTCEIECRNVMPVRITFKIKDIKAGDMLDGLAKAGRARLYIFPSKLLISPPDLLSKQESKDAHTYSTLVSTEKQIGNGKVGKVVEGRNILDVVNTKISINIDDMSASQAMITIGKASNKLSAGEYRAPSELIKGEKVNPKLTFSTNGMLVGDALSVVAAATGTQLFLLPGKFLLCAPEDLTPEEKKAAVPALMHDLAEPTVIPSSGQS